MKNRIWKDLHYQLLRNLLALSMLLVVYSVLLICIVEPVVLAVLGFLGLAVAANTVRVWTAYGTSRLARQKETEHLTEGEGVILGHIDDKPALSEGIKAIFTKKIDDRRAVKKLLTSVFRKTRPLIRLSDAVHVSCFAPTGVGKGVSIVLPHLLTCTDSMVVIDPKGENYKIACNARRRLGQRVVCIDPFNVVGGKDTFNPLDWINPDSDLSPDADLSFDDCRSLANALVIRVGTEKEPHWNDSAEAWIAAMIALVVKYGDDGDRSLQTTRPLLTDQQKMAKAIAVMCKSDAWGGMLYRLGHQLTHAAEKERGSVLTTVNRHMRFLDTPAMAANTRTSTFNPSELVTGKMTVFLVLPPEHLRAQSAAMRMWISSMLLACVRNGLQERNKVRFILDESASLGHMDCLDDAVDKYRGYGVRLLFIYQSLGQLNSCWPNGSSQTLLSNTSQVFFGVNDHQTATYVSDRLGSFTNIVESGGSNNGGSISHSPGGVSTGRSWGGSDNWSQAERRLLQPAEVAQLHPRQAICFHPGCYPIMTWLVRYYENGWMEQSLGFWRMAFTTLGLFLLSAILAVGVTAAVGSR